MMLPERGDAARAQEGLDGTLLQDVLEVVEAAADVEDSVQAEYSLRGTEEREH